MLDLMMVRGLAIQNGTKSPRKYFYKVPALCKAHIKFLKNSLGILLFDKIGLRAEMSLVTYQDKLLSPGPNTSPPKPNPEPTVFPDQKVQLGLGLTHGPPPTTQPDQ